MPTRAMEAKAKTTNASGAKVSKGFTTIKEKTSNKKPTTKKVKQNLLKVKCFNYDNHGHLVKDNPKPP